MNIYSANFLAQKWSIKMTQEEGINMEIKLRSSLTISSLSLDYINSHKHPSPLKKKKYLREQSTSHDLVK